MAWPAARAARMIARERLTAVTAASARLGHDDPEALHDFRVALRRLRTWLRAYRPALDDTVTGESRRAFARLARATNQARDTEVALAWLQALTDLPVELQADRQRLQADLLAGRQRADAAAAKDVARRLPAAAGRLSRQLAEYYVRRTVRWDTEILMATLTARLVRRQRRLVAAALARVRAPTAAAAAHRARIEGKHLRYLLEPWDADRRVAHAVRRLKTLQDKLGEHHDAQLLAARLGKSGAPELAQLAALDGTRAFTAFRRSWTARRAADELRDIAAIAAWAAALGRGRGPGRTGTRKPPAEPASAVQRRDRRPATRS